MLCAGMVLVLGSGKLILRGYVYRVEPTNITKPSNLRMIGARALKNNTSIGKLESKSPDVKYIDLGLCADRTCDRYTEYERNHGIGQMHRHAWVLHRGLSTAEVVADAEEFFGGSCIDVTAIGNPFLSVL